LHNTHKNRSNPEFNSPFNQQIYFGIVEDINDPELLGRIRVRVFGIHEESKSESDWKGILTEDLPWATVLMPVTNGFSGVGRSATGIVLGTEVALIFRDHYFQAPFVLGSVPTSNVDRPIASDLHGFQDPTEQLPKREFLNESSLPAQATGKNIQNSDLSAVAYNPIKNIPKAGASKDPIKIKIVGGS
jgi:hypothetical protein